MRRFRKILYVHQDSSDAALPTFRLALELAKRNGGQVDLIDVFDSRQAAFASATGILLRARWLKDAKKSLRAFANSVNPGNDLKIKIVEGRPHVEIVREVIRNGYDLVIKPVGPGDLIDRLLGRLDLRLLRHCPCPVWLSKGEAYGEFDTVLAAVDGGRPNSEAVEDALNRQILELAYSLCADNEARLHVGHAWYLPYMSMYTHRRAGFSKKVLDEYLSDEMKFHKNWLNRLMRRATKWVGTDMSKPVKRHTHLPQGTPGLEIPKLIEKIQADVVIMGTVARAGISGFVMGNTAEQILDKITCSVLAVKPPEFVSQVRLED